MPSERDPFRGIFPWAFSRSKDHLAKFWWGGIVFGLISFVISQTVVAPEDADFWQRVFYGAGGIIFAGLILTILTFGFAAVRAPFEQRNELRRLAKSQPVADSATQQIGEFCLALSDQMAEDIAENKRDNPRTLNWAVDLESGTGSPQWEAQQRAENAHRARLEALYARKYASRVAWVLSELERRGLADSQEIWRASHGGLSGYLIEDTMTVLGAVGRRLVTNLTD